MADALGHVPRADSTRRPRRTNSNEWHDR